MFPLPSISTKAPSLVKKLTGLRTLLQEGKEIYEKMAFRFNDEQLQRTVIILAQESHQYASEVSSQIYCLGGEMEHNQEAKKKEINKEQLFIGTDEDNICEVCDISEGKLLHFYKELLNEPNLFSGLRRMIQYQMDSFIYIISQLRLLQTSLHK